MNDRDDEKKTSAPKRRKGRGLNLASAAARAASAGRRSAVVDLKVEEDNLRRENAARLLPVSMVKPRPAADARPVDEAHVSSLIESIRVIGLMQPIYLDREFRLVAGAHRLTAFRRLAMEDTADAKRWSKIPVVVDPELDALEQPELALQREVVENEKRSNLTRDQVKSAAERLLSSDAGFTRRPGRLKSGERALTPFLANTFGVSTRHVRSLLNQPTEKKENTQGETDSEMTPEIKLSRLRQRMLKQAHRWLKDESLNQDPDLYAHIQTLTDHLNQSVSDPKRA